MRQSGSRGTWPSANARTNGEGRPLFRSRLCLYRRRPRPPASLRRARWGGRPTLPQTFACRRVAPARIMRVPHPSRFCLGGDFRHRLPYIAQRPSFALRLGLTWDPCRPLATDHWLLNVIVHLELIGMRPQAQRVHFLLPLIVDVGVQRLFREHISA